MRFNNIIRPLWIFLVMFLSSQAVSSQLAHNINVWGGAGYGSLLHGIDNTKVPGGFGFEFGLGYQMDIDRFMINVGAEFQHINSKTRLVDFSTPYMFQYQVRNIPNQQSIYITYDYELLSYEEKQSIGYLNIPIMGGIRFSRYYAMIGAKIGINLYANYTVENTRVAITATDPQFNEPMEGVGHGTGVQDINPNGKLDFGLSVAPSVEFGVYLNEWLPQGMTQIRNGRNTTPITYRVGVFADYGVLNINNSNANKPLISEPLNNNPSLINLNPLADSNLADGKNFRDFLVGVKLTVQFQMTSKRKPKTIPPIPDFFARVVDEETLLPLDAEVTLNNTAGRKEELMREMTDMDGVVVREQLKVGRYLLTAQSEGYNKYSKNIRHSKGDTLLVPMKRTPVFFVHVYDAETNENLRAEVTISSGGAAPKPVLKQETDARTGMVEGNIRTGRYQLSVTREGYIYHQEAISYTKTDTIHVALQPIKKDVVVVLHDLFFALNEAVILPESEAAMDDLYQFLTNNPSVSIHITGHTDNTGRLEYNMRLSEARAKAVFDDLVQRGVDPERITFEGRGPHEPVATNDTEEGRAQNRRVEFKIK